MALTNVLQLSNFAQLATASYATITSSATLQLGLTTTGKGDFTKTQASAFADKYDFVHQQPNDAVGFSATVFREKATGKLIFSVRGTEIPSNIVPDLIIADVFQIGPEGYAKSQATSMYRYWKQLTTVGGANVSYRESEIQRLYAISRGIGNLATLPLTALEYVNFRASVLADKGISAGQAVGSALIQPSAIVDVTGHSLGGHLAMLFSRFFPSNAGEVVTLNAPGFFAGSVLLSGIGIAPFNDAKITRIEADGDGISELGMPGFWPGNKIAIAQENVPGLVAAFSANHSSVNGSDALALLKMIATLDPTIASNTALLSGLIRTASATPGSSYELLLDGVRKLFIGPNSVGTPLSSGTNPVAREPFYLNLQTLQQNTLFKQDSGLVQIQLFGSSASASVSSAQTDIAYRYALMQLNPFVVTGDSALYGAHNTGGQLDLYDETTGTGSLTKLYLQDRAAMLSWLNKTYTEDTDIGRVYDDNAWYFKDEASGKQVWVGNPISVRDDPLLRTVLFGQAVGDILTGGTQSDHIYGGGGDDIVKGADGNDYLEGGLGSDDLQGGVGRDTLHGGQGADVLEGGIGSDTLNGGAGYDLYIFTSGDGTDTILDSDGSGTLVINGVTLTGGKLVAGTTNVWKNTPQGYTYTLKGSGANQVLLIGKDGSADGLRVQGWQAGQLGLAMAGAVAPSATTPIVGVDGYSDALAGGGGADLIQGLSGNDALDGSGGDDVIEGGVGDDLIGGGVGSDLLYGGAGRDMIMSATGLNLPGRLGQNGEWEAPAGAGAVWTSGRLWGIYASTDANGDIYIIDGGGQLGADTASDTIFAGDDDDRVIGGLGADYIDGGLSNDNLTGHGGNDLIDGGDGDDYIQGDGIILPGYHTSVAGIQHGNDVLDGGADTDTLVGGGKDDGLFGGTGNDKLWGDDQSEAQLGGQYHGSDYLDGGEQDDQLTGGGKDDFLFGGAGNDKLWGDAFSEADLAGIYHGADYLDGGDGDDQLVGDGGNDILVGGIGIDLLWGDAPDTTLSAQFHGDDILYGEAGDDQLVGGGGNDDLYGGDGTDTLLGERGTDILDGGLGMDILADGDLAALGLAHAQLVDMVNWWLRETTPTTQMAKQIVISKIVIGIGGVALADIYAANDATEKQAA